jgi:lipopolysaccharide transport system ATP-binding protein
VETPAADYIMNALTAEKSPVVSVSGVGKKFARSLGQTLRYGLTDIGGEFLLRNEPPKVLRPGEFWALDDLSFDVRPGEALAVIGRNGSGKSTLLKLLYGLIKPDAGEIRIRGRMAALIELGAGFDPLLSGRENVYINASILGLPREEVNALMPSIVEFSGLREFMQTPVKFYSSGMRARLAYSIATNLSPDVFLVDEVLAVGDAEFRQKCMRNMVQFVEKGGCLLLVSHSANQIQMLCQRGVVLDGGKKAFEGTALEALDHYFRAGLHLPKAESQEFDPPEEQKCSVVALQTEPCGGAAAIRTGAGMAISVLAEVREPLDIAPTFSIFSRDLLTVVAIMEGDKGRFCAPGKHIFRYEVPDLPLMPGLFHVKAILRESDTRLPLASFGFSNAPACFEVSGDASRADVRALAGGQLVRIDGLWK